MKKYTHTFIFLHAFTYVPKDNKYYIDKIKKLLRSWKWTMVWQHQGADIRWWDRISAQVVQDRDQAQWANEAATGNK